jgi:hypothetical protein
MGFLSLLAKQAPAGGSNNGLVPVVEHAPNNCIVVSRLALSVIDQRDNMRIIQLLKPIGFPHYDLVS